MGEYYDSNGNGCSDGTENAGTENAVIYDGRNDHVLPERLQRVMGLLPDKAVQRLRDWLTNYPIGAIEDQLDHILGASLQPPVSSTAQKLNAEETPPIDPWQIAQEAVDHVAKMFERLSQAGMSEMTAMAVIHDEIAALRLQGRTVSGFAQIPVAGARITRGADDYQSLVGHFPRPRAGWPPTEIG